MRRGCSSPRAAASGFTKHFPYALLQLDEARRRHDCERAASRTLLALVLILAFSALAASVFRFANASTVKKVSMAGVD